MDFYKLIADEGAITIYAAGYVEHTDRQIEECHGFPVEVPTPGDIVLTSLEVVIAGVGVDILPRLSQKRIDKIIVVCTGKLKQMPHNVQALQKAEKLEYVCPMRYR